MTNLPLTVCVQTVEPGRLEYDVDIVNLGVPCDGRIYTLSDLDVLKVPAKLFLRYAWVPGTVKMNPEMTFPLGDIDNLRLVGGTIRGTFRPNTNYRHYFNRFVECMNGKLILGIIAEADYYRNRETTYVNINRIIGAIALMENGHSLNDINCNNFELLSMVEKRTCNPQPVSSTSLVNRVDNDFIEIVTACGFSLADISEGDLATLRKLYHEALTHYRVNPMLIGGPSELCADIRASGLSSKQIVYIKNQIIKQLRTPRFAHVTATTY